MSRKRKVLIICGLSGFKNRMDKLDYQFMTYLQDKSKYEVTIHEAGDDYQNIKKILDSDKNAVILVFTCCPEYISEFSNKKIYYVYDFTCICRYGCDGSHSKCNFQHQLNYIKRMKFDCVFYKYETYISKKMFSDNKTDIFKKRKFPHFMFDTTRYYNKKLDKKYDILFYGATYPHGYPFRHRLYYLLKKNSHKFNLRILPYTKKKPESMITGDKLIELINQSWLTVATKNINDLLLAKYYEIALSGSVVCGDYPDLEDETFLRNHMIYIDYNMTDDQIINTIMDALKDKEKLLKIPDITFNYFSNKYTMDHGVQYFDNLIDEIP